MTILLWFMFIVCFENGNNRLVKANYENYHEHGYIPLSLLPREQFHYHLASQELSASELMVDLTNELSYRLMYYHSMFNRNNFAFSPSALMSILVALYEGSEGHSSHQLKHVLQLPNNRDTIRIGNRDIHRRLRTYFFGSENPLKGLSLNRENVSILPHYESILAFYGYDLSADMVKEVPIERSAPDNSSKEASEDEPGEESRKLDMNLAMEEKESSPEPDAELFRPTTTDRSNDTSNTPSYATSSPLIATSSSLETTERITSTTVDASTTPSTTTITATTITASITPPITTVSPSTTEAPLVSEETLADLGAELISSLINAANSETFARIQKNQSYSKPPSARLQAPLVPTPPRVKYLPAQKRSTTSFLEKRHKRHSPLKQRDEWFLSWYNTNLGKIHGSSPTFKSDRASLATFQTNADILSVDSWSFNEETSKSPPDATESARQNYNTDIINHVFYLSNQRTIYTTYKVYNAFLYHKYFEQWHMSVIELELDSHEYNLMILLPDFNSDLLSAAASLNFPTVPKLRFARKQLKPKWVQAIIPDFKLHGTTFLTNDLQNMGITDLFEPNHANFRSMTKEKGVYIRHIQQSIKIHIRTLPINQLKGNSGPQMKPIQISVNHPFIFFIVDRDLDIAVMAGRIVNPLNVRIQ